ncbi:MAG: hypothetical protein AB7R55_06170 [Gemmatimonadales bacterium]
MSLPVTSGRTSEFGAPRTLFSAKRYRIGDYRREYGVAPDDLRLVFHRLRNTRAPDRIVVIENVTRADPTRTR